MTVRPGKLDELSKFVLEKSKGMVAVVIVVSRNGATGMSINEDFALAKGNYHLRRLPKILRKIAAEIEKSNGRKI